MRVLISLIALVVFLLVVYLIFTGLFARFGWPAIEGTYSTARAH